MTLRADEAEKLSAALGRAAQATADAAKVKRWADELRPESRMDVTVRWAWGSALPGYEEIRRIIEKKVEAGMRQLIEEAVQDVMTDSHIACGRLPKVFQPEVPGYED